MTTPFKTVTVYLSERSAGALDDLVRLGKFKGYADAIATALGNELFIRQKREEGWKPAIIKGDIYHELET